MAAIESASHACCKLVPKEMKVSSVKPRFSRRDLMISSAALAGRLAMRGADLPGITSPRRRDWCAKKSMKATRWSAGSST
jgi:hypothetical protein